jgi:hypothetical protein
MVRWISLGLRSGALVECRNRVGALHWCCVYRQLYRVLLGDHIQMGMTVRVVLAVFGLLAAALIPLTVSRFGVSLFWSQALGIIVGSLPIFMAVFKREQKPAHIVVPWLIAMSIATTVAFLGRKVWL